MTLEEMKIVARIISTADGGCHTCVISMCKEANIAFPGFKFAFTNEKWSRKMRYDDGTEMEDEWIDTFPFVSVEEIYSPSQTEEARSADGETATEGGEPR